MSDPHHTPGTCPDCGKKFSHSEHAHGDATPVPGDYTVCAGCAAILVFDEGLTIRRSTMAERNAAPPELFDVVRVMAMLRPCR